MNPSRAVALTQALIRCRSVTPADGGALPMLADVLRQAGFDVHLISFGDPGEAQILNLYARLGTTAPYLVFAGHTDVVPPGDVSSWRHDPFGGELADGAVWGRGACDMKGGVAAAVAAVVGHVERHGVPNGSLGFLITGDEEGPAINGTAKLLAWAAARGERFDACLLGEPTNPVAMGDMMKIGRRGSLTGSLVVHGRQGHVAYPQRADNPIPHLMRVLAGLTERPLDGGTAHFDASNLEIVDVETGNPSSNVIPADARARFNVRFNDTWTPDTLQAEIHSRVEERAGPARCTLTFEPCNAVAFLTEPGALSALVSNAVAAETGRVPVVSTTGGTSDARFMASHCAVVEFGLVGASMHAVDERAEVADIDMLTAVYERVIRAFLPA